MRFGRKSSERKLDKVGVGKEQRKLQGEMMIQLNKKLKDTKEKVGDKSGSAEKKFNNNLKKLADDLKQDFISMQNMLKKAKRGLNRHFRSGDLLKDAKTICKEYDEDYRNLTLDNVKAFSKICEKYGVTPSDRLDYEIYRRMFETIRLIAKEKKLTPERLKMLARKIFGDLKQTGEADDGTINSVMHPFMSFMQLFVKLGLFFPQLIKEMSSGDDDNLSQISKIKDEMEKTVFKEFGVIDLTKLNDKQYRLVCKEKLVRFSAEIASLTDNINEDQRKSGSSDSDDRFGALMRRFVNC